MSNSELAVGASTSLAHGAGNAGEAGGVDLEVKAKTTCDEMYIHMGVSKNNGTPKSSILIGFSIINHPFRGFSLYFWVDTHIYIYITSYIPYDISLFPTMNLQVIPI